METILNKNKMNDSKEVGGKPNNELVNLQLEIEECKREKEEWKNKLTEVTKEMNQFAYIVSHDLQAPLRTITGFMELLERKYADKLDESAKQYIDFAVKGAGKMKKLIFDLLEYSRLSSVVQEISEVDLNIVLQEVKEKLLPVIEQTGAVVTAEHLPIVKASNKQMGQLIHHLVDNALKFRGAAAPEIKINVKKENSRWVISVNDNGIGLEPAFFEKIFIVFRRLHADETKYSGTGIGLAICKKIIELHSGTIWVESELDKGSTFYFALPL